MDYSKFLVNDAVLIRFDDKKWTHPNELSGVGWGSGGSRQKKGGSGGGGSRVRIQVRVLFLVSIDLIVTTPKHNNNSTLNIIRNMRQH